MLINSIKIRANGHAFCRSGFYSCHDTLDSNFEIKNGLNKMVGEIDSQNWALSYLLSMYKYKGKDFILDEENTKIRINDKSVSMDEISKYACYMDEIYPLFSSKKTIEKLVKRELSRSELDATPEDIRELFQMERFRFERPIGAVGNEVFKAMAAIGYCRGKEIYCFPWMSQKRFDAFHLHLSWVVEQLAHLKKVIILPLGN